MKVLILTESSKDIGFGHITRCSALYQAFLERKEGVLPVFIVNGDETVLPLLKDKRHLIFNWLKEDQKLWDFIKEAEVVVIDSYLADPAFYEKVAKSVQVPVYLDDDIRMDYPRGIVINSSIYAEKLQYPQKQGIIYLLGSHYTLLRKEFWNVGEKEIKKNIENIMVTFGGADLGDLTPKILKYLSEIVPEYRKNVVIGKGFRNIEAIESLRDENTYLFYYPDAEQMKNIMLESDIATSAGGQTLYELAKVGVPPIAITVTDNQVFGIKEWERLGFLEHAGWWHDTNILPKVGRALSILKSPEIRENKVRIGRNLLNGVGARLCVEVILKKMQEGVL